MKKCDTIASIRISFSHACNNIMPATADTTSTPVIESSMPSRRSCRIVARNTTPQPVAAVVVAPPATVVEKAASPARATMKEVKEGAPTSVLPKVKGKKGKGRDKKKEKRDKVTVAALAAVERLEDALADERTRVRTLTGQAKKLAAKVDELEMVKHQYS